MDKGNFEKQTKHYHPLKWIIGTAAVIACAAAVFLLKPVGAYAEKNLMADVKTQKVQASGTPDKSFVKAQTDFAVKLFQKTAVKGKNSLISPVSVSMALGMTANGAGGETLKEFQSLLGGGMDRAKLNLGFAAEAGRLKQGDTGKILLANSIWYRNKNLTVEKGFLESNAEYFGASAYQLDFSNAATPGKINAWVKKNTGGTIDKMVDTINPDTVMYLINAMYLEQEWKSPYHGSSSGTFHTADGDVTAQFMNSEETYLHSGSAEGFLKPLKDTRYAFAAILPESGTAPEEYAQDLTGDSFLALMRSAGQDLTDASLPKFQYDFSADLSKPLQTLGLKTAFDSNRADFRAMGKADGNLFISNVKHKTHIQVDELGVKAGAVTEVAMSSGAALAQHRVVCDRPFLYTIIDTETQLPIFLGIVSTPTTA